MTTGMPGSASCVCNGSMPEAPAAELTIDEALVGRLLSEQAPAMVDLPVSHLSSGWDNEVFRLGEGLLVRLPRREQAARQVSNVIRWLPEIGSSVSVAVPAPVYAGQPSASFAWPWMIVELIPGENGADVPVAQRSAFAEGLADFYWSLHVPAPADAPLNPVRGLSLNQDSFDGKVRSRVVQHPRAADLLERWDAWRAADDWDGIDVWVHGDPHPDNLIVAGNGRLGGVVDWDDVTAGDPACDLAMGWLAFDADGRRRFVDRANQSDLYDAATWTRAKAWALHLGLLLALHNDDRPTLAAIGRHGLEQVLAEQA